MKNFLDVIEVELEKATNFKRYQRVMDSFDKLMELTMNLETKMADNQKEINLFQQKNCIDYFTQGLLLRNQNNLPIYNDEPCRNVTPGN
jgi:hypothetical protein